MKLDYINELIIHKFRLSGMWRSYWDNGNVFMEKKYKNGLLDGYIRSWSIDGHLNWESHYKNGWAVELNGYIRGKKAG